MSKRQNKAYCLFLVICCCGLFTADNNENINCAENPLPFFYIDVLAPYSYTLGQIPTLMVEQLPKIGIGVDIFDRTGWAQIAPRTWDYPGPYPIPTYEEGGYDTLFLGWSWGLDWDPTELFDSSSITPNGDNFYQYSSQEMDWAIRNYTFTDDSNIRDFWGKEIQKKLFYDLPQISIFYSMDLYAFDKNFTGWDGLLWSLNYQNMDTWSIEGQTEFHYATPTYFDDFHVYSIQTDYDAQWLYQIYDSLAERTPLNNRTYSPKLASSITSTDGLSYNIKLNPGVKWADGTNLTTADIEYSYSLKMANFSSLNSILDWPSYTMPLINIISDTELDMTFSTNYVFQEIYFDLPIIPKHIWENYTATEQVSQAKSWAINNPHKIFGSGPYYLEEYNSTLKFIHLKRNDYYYEWSNSNPKFSDIYFDSYSYKEAALLALSSGTADMIDAGFTIEINEIPINYCKYELVKGPLVIEIGINMQHPIIGTGEYCPISGSESARYIRKAISHLIPREIIVKELFNGIGAPGVTACPLTATIYDESLESLNYSIELAKHQMVLAGYEYEPGITGTTSNIAISIVYFIELIGFVGGNSVIIKKKKSDI